MVKGISRQVIVVRSPDQKLFEQAIFILKDEAVGAEGITNDALLKSAKKILHSNEKCKNHKKRLYGPIWAIVGALLTGIVGWIMQLI